MSPPFVIKVPRMLVLTTEAIYIMEILSPEAQRQVHSSKPIPEVILRRRIGYKINTNNRSSSSNLSNNYPDGTHFSDGTLDGLQITTLADGLLCFQMTPVSKIIDPKKNVLTLHPNWPSKESIQLCQKSEMPFNFLFDRKFRCKVSGSIVREAVCNEFQPNPDFGYYTPIRVMDDLYGLKSLDQIEDTLVVCYKKTEFLGLLLNEWEHLYKHRNILSYVSKNAFQLRSGPNPETTCVPAKIINIRADKAINDDTATLMSLDTIDANNQALIIRVCEGIPESIVDSRRQRKKQQAAQALIERKKKDAERKKRNEERAKEAEKNRLVKNKEKQAMNTARRNEMSNRVSNNTSVILIL